MGSTDKAFGLFLIIISIIMIFSSSPSILQATSTSTGGGMVNATGTAKVIFDFMPLFLALFSMILLIAGLAVVF